MFDRAKICRALCESGRFETGEGTCAFFCMQNLGSARGGPHGCPDAERIHGKLADEIIQAVGPT